MLLKVFENIERVWFNTKHINHWSLNKVAQKRHEVTSFVIWDWEFDEIASYQIQRMLVEDHEIVMKFDFLLNYDAEHAWILVDDEFE